MMPKPLANAHSHNDYAHARPLLDALDQGFCSVEADIYLVDGKLLVGHNREDLKPERTLDALYLAPLFERFKRNNGSIYPEKVACSLLIDIKADSARLWPVLERELYRYRPMLTRWRGDLATPGALTVVLSGDRPAQQVAAARERYAALDGRPSDLGKGYPAGLYPWISESWFGLFKYAGVGLMSRADREKLADLVARIHDEGRKVRFWGYPDTPAFWGLQRAAGVDIINTDRLAELAAFLLDKPAPPTR